MILYVYLQGKTLYRNKKPKATSLQRGFRGGKGEY